jgi:hypothetical protein
MANAKNHELIAREFWQGTGLADRFPRDIEKAVALKLPLALVKMPRVTVPAIRRWLEARYMRAQVPYDRRELMGCLVAYRGFGIAFVCGADPEDEQRLTVAHETSHFLRDYLLPRQQILHAMGEQIADVLDGKRPPTPAERASAVLCHVHLGAHVHLLPRHGQDEDSDPIVGHAEDRADLLGLELVAPQEQISALLRAARGASQSAQAICATLAGHFGLPTNAFTRIVGVTNKPRIISFLEDIRSALEGRS